MRTRTAIFVLIGCVAGRDAGAQAERYELGQRLKRFEQAWETADEAGRARALAVVKPVSRQFLTFQLTAAGKTLDDARFALRPDPVTDEERWAAAVAVRPLGRLIDAAAKSLKVEVSYFYPPSVKLQEKATVTGHFTLTDAPAGLATADLTGRTVVLDVPLPPTANKVDERLLGIRLVVGARTIGQRSIPIYRVADLDGRLAALRKAVAPKIETIEQATLADRTELFDAAVRREEFESDMPFLELFPEAETLAGLGARPWFTPERFGGRRLTVPTADGKRTACRLYVPPNLDAKRPVPVVVALHGAGGSENLFFEGYGAGCVVKECSKRGWLMVSPRADLALFGGGTPPVTEIIDKLATRYPIDRKRVFLVGHSMGAAHAVELAQRHPGAFAVVAALGGGGRVRKTGAFSGVPTIVGVGTEDFARGGAVGLHKSLTDAGVKGVTLKEYPGVEHLTVVRVAVGDVFAAFDGTAREENVE